MNHVIWHKRWPQRYVNFYWLFLTARICTRLQWARVDSLSIATQGHLQRRRAFLHKRSIQTGTCFINYTVKHSTNTGRVKKRFLIHTQLFVATEHEYQDFLYIGNIIFRLGLFLRIPVCSVATKSTVR